MRLVGTVALALLVASSAHAAAEKPKLDMLGFFAGNTHADNVMKIALQETKTLTVDSIGGRNKEGEFVLIDTVHEQDKPVRTRTWVMHAVGDNHFTGFLSDAKGPVDVVISGNTATIRYTMKDGGLKIVQRLELQADGKTMSNHVEAKKFGLKFGRVDGTVRKLD
jgi:hypothetical protein